MTSSLKYFLAIAGISCVFNLNIANAALINGDFSTNNVANGTFKYANTLGSITGGATAQGWNFTGYAGISENTNSFSTFNTNQTYAFLQYNANTIPEIAQTFTETSNSLLNISFDMYSREVSGAFALNVFLNGTQLNANPLVSSGFTTFKNFSFSALSSSTGTNTLLFRGVNPSGNDRTLFLDNVSVTAAVPEPSTYAMMGIGLLGVIGMSRRRQKLAY